MIGKAIKEKLIDIISTENNVKHDAVIDAFIFSKKLEDDWMMPNVNPVEDGELNLCWRKDNLMIDLGFYGDGKYSYFARDFDGNEYKNDKVKVSEALPKELEKLIKGEK